MNIIIISCSFISASRLSDSSETPYRDFYLANLYRNIAGSDISDISDIAESFQEHVNEYVSSLDVDVSVSELYSPESYMHSVRLPTGAGFPLALSLIGSTKNLTAEIDFKTNTDSREPCPRMEMLLAALRFIELTPRDYKESTDRMVAVTGIALRIVRRSFELAPNAELTDLYMELRSAAAHHPMRSKLLSSGYRLYRILFVLTGLFRMKSAPTRAALFRFEKIVVYLSQDPSLAEKAIHAMFILSESLSLHLVNRVRGVDDSANALGSIEWINSLVDTPIESQLYECMVMIKETACERFTALATLPQRWWNGEARFSTLEERMQRIRNLWNALKGL